MFITMIMISGSDILITKTKIWTIIICSRFEEAKMRIIGYVKNTETN